MSDYTTLTTPVGPFTAIVDGSGAVLASGWTDSPDLLRSLIHPTLRPQTLSRKRDLGRVTQAVTDYHAGDLTVIDSIPVTQQSGDFLMHAWDVLRDVDPQAPITYSEFAARAGRPAAIRGAASACARNAAALFVPCHRVFRVGGALGGFRYGLPIKRWLLDHEAPAAT
ncbi:Methylated-DNA--protein-cysteine methyltransferase [Mycobacteroides salmoniphilum]|uniref:Methylated-DNA--protein-cysteine methyltransferase n=1 Tax=Mycobacteroides salmoniphilum TaxID=404941 RepID=A0A4R8S1Z5_9MYCO|nr:methylated-DNA--[protein]-cysteine S-methyltransferase [Mycobacteroides salmoniphilum]TDZ80045.1 Methylated-DNA--protein-cysteine methyltransferase [Mycobacteroides salmoniphilum]